MRREKEKREGEKEGGREGGREGGNNAPVNLNISSHTSTTRSRYPLGFILPFSSNSVQAFGTLDWLGMVIMRIHRPEGRKEGGREGGRDGGVSIRVSPRQCSLSLGHA
jgi:hypothetical protein